MEQTKKKVNVLAIVSASIAILAGLFGLIFGGETFIALSEGEFLTAIQCMAMFFEEGGDSLLYGIIDLFVILAFVLVLAGGVVGLIGAILRKTSLLRVAKVLGVVAIPVCTVFYWCQMGLWLASTNLLLIGTFIVWLLGLAYSITMMIAYSQALKAEKAAE